MDNNSFAGYIGVSEADITPPPGIYMGNWGAATSPVSTGVHLPLIMTCITFQTGPDKDPLVLLGMDLGWWKDATDELSLRKGLLKYFSLPVSNLLICLSHTHSGPSICRKDGFRPGGEHIERYLELLKKTAISLIKETLDKADESVLAWEYGHCNLAKNRDLKDPENDRYLVGYNPDETADHTVLCGRITNSIGQITGTIVNYACHPTTLAWDNTLISPDYIGAMRATIKSKTRSPVFFIQGASGELAPILQYVGDPDIADQHGRQLGYSVLSVLESMPSPKATFTYQGAVESGASLALWAEHESKISCCLSSLLSSSSYRIQNFPLYSELEKVWRTSSDPIIKERLWRKMCIRKAIGDEDKADIPFWIWKLGGAFIIAQPNETYSIFQQYIRSQLPDRMMAVGNLVNGSIGYLPPQELFDKDIYSVWQTPFAKGSLETLMKETIKGLKKIDKES